MIPENCSFWGEQQPGSFWPVCGSPWKGPGTQSILGDFPSHRHRQFILLKSCQRSLSWASVESSEHSFPQHSIRVFQRPWLDWQTFPPNVLAYNVSKFNLVNSGRNTGTSMLDLRLGMVYSLWYLKMVLREEKKIKAIFLLRDRKERYATLWGVLLEACLLYFHMTFSLNMSLCLKLSFYEISHIGLGPVLRIFSH